jgi:hypothetical protein
MMMIGQTAAARRYTRGYMLAVSAVLETSFVPFYASRYSSDI